MALSRLSSHNFFTGTLKFLHENHFETDLTAVWIYLGRLNVYLLFRLIILQTNIAVNLASVLMQHFHKTNNPG
jgi:hypothetical protein